MQNPTIIFDHVKKVIAVTGTGPAADRKAADFAVASQRQQASASGLSKA